MKEMYQRLRQMNSEGNVAAGRLGSSAWGRPNVEARGQRRTRKLSPIEGIAIKPSNDEVHGYQEALPKPALERKTPVVIENRITGEKTYLESR